MTNVCVVIPCYRVKDQILDVLAKIGPEVNTIFCIDDACPDNTGSYIVEHTVDNRVNVITHKTNQGVGGAVLTGYEAAINAKADIIIKLDGDGQMDPRLIPKLIAPITAHRADYVKGNRLYSLARSQQMPIVRKIGNLALSFMNKFSTGYWNIFDPTNGYTAIHAKVAHELPFNKIAKRFFFESDLLFRLNTIRAVICDIPMTALYNNETSNLNIWHACGVFLVGHIKNYIKRIIYSYYVRNFTIASIELFLSLILITFGITIGSLSWAASINTGIVASSGTVMLAALPIVLGFQLLLSFLNYDINAVPQQPLHEYL